MTRWTPGDDDKKLRKLWAENKPINEIARTMGFSERAIQYKARSLRLPHRQWGRLPEHARNAEIVARANNGTSMEALGIEFGLSRRTIANIVTKGNRGKEVKG